MQPQIGSQRSSLPDEKGNLAEQRIKLSSVFEPDNLRCIDMAKQNKKGTDAGKEKNKV
jgi:hypothetical protein